MQDGIWAGPARLNQPGSRPGFVIITRLSRKFSDKALFLKNSTLQAKLDYWEKVRRLNYAASMRLEGYPLTPADAKRELPSREAVLRAYRKPA